MTTRNYANRRTTSTGNVYYMGNGITFDASKANAIYGSSSTVQPPAIALIPQLRY